MIKYLTYTDTNIKILRIVSITDQLCYKNTSIAHSSKFYMNIILKIATIIISQQNKILKLFLETVLEKYNLFFIKSWV